MGKPKDKKQKGCPASRGVPKAAESLKLDVKSLDEGLNFTKPSSPQLRDGLPSDKFREVTSPGLGEFPNLITSPDKDFVPLDKLLACPFSPVGMRVDNFCAWASPQKDRQGDELFNPLSPTFLSPTAGERRTRRSLSPSPHLFSPMPANASPPTAAMAGTPSRGGVVDGGDAGSKHFGGGNKVPLSGLKLFSDMFSPPQQARTGRRHSSQPGREDALTAAFSPASSRLPTKRRTERRTRRPLDFSDCVAQRPCAKSAGDASAAANSPPRLVDRHPQAENQQVPKPWREATTRLQQTGVIGEDVEWAGIGRENRNDVGARGDVTEVSMVSGESHEARSGDAAGSSASRMQGSSERQPSLTRQARQTDGARSTPAAAARLPMTRGARRKSMRLSGASMDTDPVGIATESATPSSNVDATSGPGGVGMAVRDSALEVKPTAAAAVNERSGDAVSGGRAPRADDLLRCNCKKSSCLKLYCVCFRAGLYCDRCNCLDCHNQESYAETVVMRRSSILSKNSKAFQSKTQEGQHNRGCHCKRSHCLKKYCECYAAGIACGHLCKCIDCSNQPGDREAVLAKQGLSSAAAASPMQRSGLDVPVAAFCSPDGGDLAASPAAAAGVRPVLAGSRARVSARHDPLSALKDTPSPRCAARSSPGRQRTPHPQDVPVVPAGSGSVPARTCSASLPASSSSSLQPAAARLVSRLVAGVLDGRAVAPSQQKSDATLAGPAAAASTSPDSSVPLAQQQQQQQQLAISERLAHLARGLGSLIQPGSTSAGMGLLKPGGPLLQSNPGQNLLAPFLPLLCTTPSSSGKSGQSGAAPPSSSSPARGWPERGVHATPTSLPEPPLQPPGPASMEMPAGAQATSPAEPAPDGMPGSAAHGSNEPVAGAAAAAGGLPQGPGKVDCMSPSPVASGVAAGAGADSAAVPASRSGSPAVFTTPHGSLERAFEMIRIPRSGMPASEGAALGLGLAASPGLDIAPAPSSSAGAAPLQQPSREVLLQEAAAASAAATVTGTPISSRQNILDGGLAADAGSRSALLDFTTASQDAEPPADTRMRPLAASLVGENSLDALRFWQPHAAAPPPPVGPAPASASPGQASPDGQELTLEVKDGTGKVVNRMTLPRAMLQANSPVSTQLQAFMEATVAASSPAARPPLGAAAAGDEPAAACPGRNAEGNPPPGNLGAQPGRGRPADMAGGGAPPSGQDGAWAAAGRAAGCSDAAGAAMHAWMDEPGACEHAPALAARRPLPGAPPPLSPQVAGEDLGVAAGSCQAAAPPAAAAERTCTTPGKRKLEAFQGASSTPDAGGGADASRTLPRGPFASPAHSPYRLSRMASASRPQTPSRPIATPVRRSTSQRSSLPLPPDPNLHLPARCGTGHAPPPATLGASKGQAADSPAREALAPRPGLANSPPSRRADGAAGAGRCRPFASPPHDAHHVVADVSLSEPGTDKGAHATTRGLPSIEPANGCDAAEAEAEADAGKEDAGKGNSSSAAEPPLPTGGVVVAGPCEPPGFSQPLAALLRPPGGSSPLAKGAASPGLGQP